MSDAGAPAGRARRQPQHRQDHAVQRADRQPRAGRQLPGRDGREARGRDRRLDGRGARRRARRAGHLLAGARAPARSRSRIAALRRPGRRAPPGRRGAVRRRHPARARPVPGAAGAGARAAGGRRADHDRRGRATRRPTPRALGRAARLSGGAGGRAARAGASTSCERRSAALLGAADRARAIWHWRPSPALAGAASARVRAALPPGWPASDALALWALMSVERGRRAGAASRPALRAAARWPPTRGAALDDEAIARPLRLARPRGGAAGAAARPIAAAPSASTAC